MYLILFKGQFSNGNLIYDIVVLFQICVFYVLGFYNMPGINSKDFNTMFDLSYEKLCMKIFLYQGLMLKIQKANNIYIMFMVFDFQGRLG